MRKFIAIASILFLVTACGDGRKVSIENISQEDFAKLNTTEIQLLDVRTPEEVDQGIIEGSKVVNFYDEDFATKARIQFDKSKPLYIYCAAGGRSSKASSQMVLEGFDQVYNLVGGYREWIKNQKE